VICRTQRPDKQVKNKEELEDRKALRIPGKILVFVERL
jgi:hypothetical protein